MRVIVLLVCLALAGCAFGNPEMVDAMRNNNATFCAKVQTVWGTALYFQSNPVFGTATCDTMTVNYGNPNGVAGGVSVPVVITPSVSVGQPVLVPAK